MARDAKSSPAPLRWLGVTPPPDLTLPNPRTVKLADDRTDEWSPASASLRPRVRQTVRLRGSRPRSLHDRLVGGQEPELAVETVGVSSVERNSPSLCSGPPIP
jgi:hypothetical protein